MGKINIKNKKINFQYELLEEYIAGIELKGTEIKSLRNNKASITESFCQIKNGEIYVINMQIEPYIYGTHENHLPKRERKLLLKKKEIHRLSKKVKESGLSIIPKRIFLNNKNYAKIQLFLAKGKKTYDKRQSIKKKDLEREQGRNLKYR